MPTSVHASAIAQQHHFTLLTPRRTLYTSPSATDDSALNARIGLHAPYDAMPSVLAGIIAQRPSEYQTEIIDADTSTARPR
jgi:hypothetical protein